MLSLVAESAPVATDGPLTWTATVIGAYLVGSIPTAHLLAKRRGVDLGQVGSKSYGATNLGRTLGRTWGVV